MAEVAAPRDRAIGQAAPDPGSVLGALAFPVIVVGSEDRVHYVNAAAEQFFGQGANHLLKRSLAWLVGQDSPLFTLLAQIRGSGTSISEFDVRLSLPRGQSHQLAIHAAPFGDDDGFIVLSLLEQGTARTIERQLSHRGAARSVTAMAAMLAHEVKNPLSGIRGAAQLIEQTAEERDRGLTRLICEETDRICALVDRMEAFADDRPPEHGAVNIHEVLERVQRLAEAGFGRGVRFTNDYDPSLPAVYGNRDQLVQVFLNLIKNAAEAVPDEGGEIHLATAFRHGIRFAVQGQERQVQLPLLITVADNGPGVPGDIGPHLFDAFITGKPGGTGLGLALVAKIVNDHGGIVEFDSDADGTTFKVMLPMQGGMDENPGASDG
jgi:two-component system nitrogen regulation sensor histidine kinase GlnL